MKTQDIDHPHEVSVASPEDELGAALVMMAEQGIHHLPVIDDDEKVVGLISARDILQSLVVSEGLEDPLEETVGATMRQSVPTIDENTEVREVLKIMREQGFSALPVVEKGQLTGIVTETDMLRALEKVLQQKDAGSDAAVAGREVLTNPLLQRVVHFLGQVGI